jgi:hypothetical protein
MSYTQGRYFLIKNSETGEEIVFDKHMSRYKRLGYGFLNGLKLEPRFLKHIILTQRVESYKPNHLNDFFNCMRRFYKDLIYI